MVRPGDEREKAAGVSWWYVAGFQPDRFGLMLGPFRNRESAVARVDEVRKRLRQLGQKPDILGAGMLPIETARFDVYEHAASDEPPLGQLNRLGYMSLDQSD